MSRKYGNDAKPFKAKDGIEQISGMYGPFRSEVRRFLRSNMGSGNLQGTSNEKIYALIKEKLGYPIPV